MISNWKVQYYQYVMATDPIAYYMLDEKSGTVAYDLVSRRIAGAQNGTHSGVTLYQPGLGDGRRSPLYDGINDYTNIYSATFNGAFDGDEGSVMVWGKVANAGVWTDGTLRKAILLLSNGSNFIRIHRPGAPNNLIEMNQVAGGTAKGATITVGPTLDWFQLALTWSRSAGVNGEVRLYLNGAQSGATLTALGAWAGNLSATQTVIGAASTVPAEPWSGYLAHVPIWDRPITADEVLTLYEAGISQ